MFLLIRRKIRRKKLPPEGYDEDSVATADGCCLPDCHCVMMTTTDIGRAMTIGSTAVHGDPSSVTFPKRNIDDPKRP
jgi:hypothetical protein